MRICCEALVLKGRVKTVGLQASNRFDGGETNKPDIVVMEKKEGKCLVIDIARPFDTRISEDWKNTPRFEEGAQKDLEV